MYGLTSNVQIEIYVSSYQHLNGLYIVHPKLL
jgi:hypothetical protein